jgi:hypothetical protein
MRVEEYRCDYCGGKCAPEFELTRGDLFDDERMEMHFCSWKCLAQYSHELVEFEQTKKLLRELKRGHHNWL